MVPLIVEVLPQVYVYVSTPCFHRVIFFYERHTSKLVAHHTKQHPSSDDQTSSTKETLEQHRPSLVLNRLSVQCRFCQSTTLSFLQLFKRSLLCLAINPEPCFQQRFGTSLIHFETSFFRGVDGRRDLTSAVNSTCNRLASLL